MSEPWANARVEAELDYGAIDEELAKRLERSVRIATAACRRHFQQLETTASRSAANTGSRWEQAANRIGRAVERADERAGRALASLSLKAQREATRMADSYDREFGRVERRTRVAAERMRVALQNIAGDVRIQIDTARFMADIRAVRRLGQAYLTANPLRIGVTVDNDQVHAMLARALAGTSHTVRARVDVDDRGGLRRAATDGTRLTSILGRLGGAASSVGGSVLSAASTIVKFGAAGGAAVLAVGALIPLLGALVAGLGAVAVAGGAAAAAGLGATVLAVGALKTGFSGISDAFTTSAASGGAAGASAANTARQVASAQYNLTQAVKDEASAQKGVADARRSALEKLQDLNGELRNASLNEKDAALSLREAQRDLAKGKFEDPEERDRALLRVEQAQQRLSDVQLENTRIERDAQETRRKGINGADEVVAANDRLAQAQHSRLEAQQALADAKNPDSAGGGGGVDKQAEAMAKLAPNARALVQTLLNLRPAWEAVQRAVQNTLFAGIAEQVGPLARNLLPSLTSALTTVAGGFNQGARSALGFINSAQGVGMVRTLLGESSSMGAQFGQAIGNLVPGLLAVGTASSQVFGPMTRGLGEAARGFSDMLVRSQQTGQMQQTIAKAVETAKQLGAALSQVGQIIGAVFSAAAQANGGNALGGITDRLRDVNEFLSAGPGRDALVSFFTAASQAAAALLPILSQVFVILGGTIAPAIAGLVTQLAPVISTVVDALGQAFAALAPAIGPLGAAISSILAAVSPLIPVVGQLLAAFVQIVGPILSQLANALAPILASLGPILGDLLSATAPLVAQVADAVVQLLAAVGPLLPVLGEAFITVISAIVPILGQLASILGPILGDVITALVPVIVTIADTFAQVLEAVSPLLPVLGQALTQVLAAVLPLIQQMAGLWSQMVLALLPLLPPLIQIVQALLPPLLQVVLALLPAMFTMVSAFVNIATAIAPVLVVVAQLGAKFAELLGTIIGWGADALGAVVSFADGVVSFFSKLPGRITGAIGGLWDGLVSGFKTALNALISLWNNFSLGVDFEIPIINKRVKFNIDTPNIPLFNQGGPVPMLAGATRGRDSILAGIAPGEYIEPANRVNARTTPLLDAIRAGWVPSAGQLAALLRGGDLPGFVEGGKVSATALVDFARGVEGKPYEWGGVNWGDCSGAVSAIANYATGRAPFGSRFATGSEDGELMSRGFQPGLGPTGSLNIGWYNGGPYGGHTAATLPDGTNFEMGGQRGDGQFGGGAAGAGDDMFTDHAHLPPDYFIGLDAGAPTTGGGAAPTAPPAAPSTGGTAPAGGSSTGGGASSTGSTAVPASPGVGATTSSSTMPFGQARANAWLGEQDFAGQARTWGTDALKEVVGGFTDPIGFKGLSDQGIDALATAITDAIKRNNQPQTFKYADTVNITGGDPAAVKTATTAGMTAATETLRGG